MTKEVPSTNTVADSTLNSHSDLGISHSIKKPSKILVPIERGLLWGSDLEFVYQEKMDGRFMTLTVGIVPGSEIGAAVLAGEEMASGDFYAFDLLRFMDEDARPWPLHKRGSALCAVMNHYYCPDVHLVPTFRNGGEALRTVLARGGEGVVRKRLDAPWGVPMEACKRLQTFFCTVTGFNSGKQSVMVSVVSSQSSVVPGGEAQSSAQLTTDNGPLTSVALRAGKCDQVRVGSILKVEGFGLTAAGKIREPRLCKDTGTSWLVQY